jgi:hypothetical protein
MARQLTAYRGNKNLKRSNIQHNFTEEQVREWVKCAQDPIYFIETYVKVVHVDRGLIPMILYEYQKEIITAAVENRRVICKIPRQAGKSTCVAAFALHQILFIDNYNILIAANKGKTAQEIMKKVQTSFEHLPKWLQQGIVPGGFNKSTIELENGSRCMATSTSADSARGYAFNVVILDEFAFLPRTVADEFFTSIYPTISSGETTKMIVISTPKGLNHFYKMYTEAVDKKTDYLPIEIEWDDVPGRDEKFKEEQIRNFGSERWQQEFECAFLGSSNTLISARKLRELTFNDPIKKVMDDINIFEMPKKDRLYFITFDGSEGKNLDYHAFIVYDITERPFNIVATWRNRSMDPLLVPDVLYHAGMMYNYAFILIESKSSGSQIAGELYYKKEYLNLLGAANNHGRNGQQLTNYSRDAVGLNTSERSRDTGCTNLRMIIENDQIFLNDHVIIEELSNFALQTNRKYKAEEGFNDDLVMCLVVFAWATTQTFFQNLSEVNVRDILAERQKEISEYLLPMYSSDGMSHNSLDDDFDSEFARWMLV